MAVVLGAGLIISVVNNASDDISGIGGGGTTATTATTATTNDGQAACEHSCTDGICTKCDYVCGHSLSDTAANGIENAPGTAFVQSESNYSCDFLNECVPYEASFSRGETECVYTYDSITGIPLCLCADTGEVRAEIKIKKFKTEQ